MATAFSGADDFSPGVCARAVTVVSDKSMKATNQLGNEFILIVLLVLFRSAGAVQPHDLANSYWLLIEESASSRRRQWTLRRRARLPLHELWPKSCARRPRQSPSRNE